MIRDDATKKKLLARLRRAEGQVAAVRRMIESDAYCVDVLTQLSAANAALSRVGHLLLGDHVRSCVADAMRRGDEDEREAKVQELVDVFGRWSGGR